MKLSTLKLRAFLSAASRIVDPKSSIPVVRTVRVEPFDGGARLAVTNLDETLTATVSGSGEKMEPICLDFAGLSLAVAAMTGDETSIEIVKTRAAISDASARFKVPFLPAVDFPTLPDVTTANPLGVVASSALADISAAASSCIAGDVSRGAYTDALVLDLDGGTLAGWATDSHRAARLIVKVERNGATGKHRFIIRGRGARALASVTGDALSLAGDERVLFLSSAESVLALRLAEVNLPPVENVFGKVPSETATVARAEILAAAKHVASFARGLDAAALLDVKGESVTVELISRDYGEAALDCKATATNAVKLSLDSRYLVAAVESVRTERVEIGWLDANSAVYFRPVGGGEQVYLVAQKRK